MNDDICMLPEVTDITILQCIEERYKRGITYTKVGEQLITVNPSHLDSSPRLPDSDVAAFTAGILASLIASQEDQSIIVYGRSGAGKTTVAASIIQQLADGRKLLKQLVSQAERVVSAFTQSRAPSNSNRSHALHIFTCSFSVEDSQPCGFEISSLLLDAHPALPNLSQRRHLFHVLRYVSSSKAAVSLTSGLRHNAPLPSCSTEEEDEKRRFAELDAALTELQFSDEERRGIYAVLSAILQLGVLGDDYRKLADSLQVDAARLQDLRTSPNLAELLYSHLYYWILQKINSFTRAQVLATSQVAVIDPIGCSGMNQVPGSFNELLSSYIDELLFNMQWLRLFDWEQSQYVEEEVAWEHVDVSNKSHLLQDFDRVGGLLECLEEKSSASMIEKIHNVAKTSSDILTTQSLDIFVIVHYNGEHTYQVMENLIAVNNAHPSPELISLLKHSTNPVVQAIAEVIRTSSLKVLGESINSPCYSRRVRIAMNAVEDMVTSSSPHFVYCLAPDDAPILSDSIQRKVFNSLYVLQQVQDFQLVDSALMQSTGYPVHIAIEDFVCRYGSSILHQASSPSTAESCKNILKTLGLDGWAVGRTKVLLKPWHLAQLDSMAIITHQSAKTVQEAFRRHSSVKTNKKKTSTLPSSVTQSSLSPIMTRMLTPSSSRSLPALSMLDRLAHFPPDSSSSVGTCEFKQSGIDEDNFTLQVTETNVPQLRKKPSWARNKSLIRPSMYHSTTSSDDNLSYTFPRDLWLYGNLSREAAEDVLASSSEGSFLIRESQNQKGSFTLSLRHACLAKHFRINKREGSGRYCLDGSCATFGTLSSLVQYYSLNCITSSGEMLKRPCVLKGDNIPPPLPPRRLLSTKRMSNNFEDKEQSTSRVLNSIEKELSSLQKEVELEEKIIIAAKRLIDMPGTNKDKQQRRESLKDAQSRLYRLKQQCHTLQDRKRLLETLNPITAPF